ncbi:hypothetical protein [Pectobacterium polaris]|uniref:hypothetical protein n=1 Tax=Pectobacterium polaris TaxID=2042057 RepID=UPI000EA281BB|nr:hypothetical protein [Pectobacterium polaris]RJL19354.1 hypothetical protein D5074_18455 [Pectobacterium polaris]
MAVNSIDFLNFAIDSASRGDEIGYRNAVARSYYCAYHTVCPLMKGGPKDSHQGLINYLSGDAWRTNAEIYDKDNLKSLSFILKFMKDQRCLSDYVLDGNVRKKDADVAISTCNKLINKCSAMSRLAAS